MTTPMQSIAYLNGLRLGLNLTGVLEPIKAVYVPAESLTPLRVTGFGAVYDAELTPLIKACLWTRFEDSSTSTSGLTISPGPARDGPGVPTGHGSLALTMALAAYSARTGATSCTSSILTLYAADLDIHGNLRPINGAYVMAEAARDAGFRSIVMAPGSAQEAALVEGITALEATTFDQALHYFQTGTGLSRAVPSTLAVAEPANWADMELPAAVFRAAEICAAGGHSLLLFGDASARSTRLARRMLDLVPPPGPKATAEIRRAWSVAGYLGGGHALGLRPYRCPHHSIGLGSLLGGMRASCVGELALAHGGVFQMSDIEEYTEAKYVAVRTALRQGYVQWATGRVPCRALLVGTCTPRGGTFKIIRERSLGFDVAACVSVEGRPLVRGEPTEVVRARVARAQALKAVSPGSLGGVPGTIAALDGRTSTVPADHDEAARIASLAVLAAEGVR